MVVTVYSRPHDECYKCRLTAKALEKEGIPYESVDLMGRPDLADKFRTEGLAIAPVVVVDLGDDATWTWNDFRLDDIKRLGKLFRGEPVEQAA